MIYASDIGLVLGKTANKTDRPRKIIQIDPQSGAQTVLAATVNDFTIPMAALIVSHLKYLWFLP